VISRVLAVNELTVRCTLIKTESAKKERQDNRSIVSTCCITTGTKVFGLLLQRTQSLLLHCHLPLQLTQFLHLVGKLILPTVCSMHAWWWLWVWCWRTCSQLRSIHICLTSIIQLLFQKNIAAGFKWVLFVNFFASFQVSFSSSYLHAKTYVWRQRKRSVI